MPRRQTFIISPLQTHNLEQEKHFRFHFFLISVLVNIQKRRIKAAGKCQDLKQYTLGKGFTLKCSIQERISHNICNY